MAHAPSESKGFTLIEILLVVAALAILAGIVIIAINPTKQLGETRNSQRRADVNTLMSAVYQYSLDNNGQLPPSVPTTATPICTTTGSDCTGMVDLGVLTANEKYLVAIPKDPQAPTSPASSAGYTIERTVNNRVKVTAPQTELLSTPISISR